MLTTLPSWSTRIAVGMPVMPYFTAMGFAQPDRLSTSMEQRRPGDVVLFDVVFGVAAFFVERDADDVEAFVVILQIVRQHVWHFGAARSTPRGPVVDQHDFAAIRIPIEFRAVEEIAGELELVAGQIQAAVDAFEHGSRS